MAVDAVAAERTVTRSIGIGCATAVLMLSGAGIAVASPEQDGQAPSCAYTLSEPFVVDVSGVRMVSATFSSLPCTGVILPNEQTVCVELKGGGGAPKCTFASGYRTAQVYFAPYRPGATYASTGKGCGAAAPAQVSICDSRGPYTVTL